MKIAPQVSQLPPVSIQEEKKPISSPSSIDKTSISNTSADKRAMRPGFVSTPSISSLFNEVSVENITEPVIFGSTSAKIADSFDETLLKEVWREFSETIEAPALKNALMSREPHLLENYIVEYHLDNDLQRDRIVIDLKHKLLGFLHRKLKNEQIELCFIVSVNTKEIFGKPYTDEEKYKVMVEKYPLLDVLKQKLGLDFE